VFCSVNAFNSKTEFKFDGVVAYMVNATNKKSPHAWAHHSTALVQEFKLPTVQPQ